jgi:hypothetical protein
MRFNTVGFASDILQARRAAHLCGVEFRLRRRDIMIEATFGSAGAPR